MQKLIIDKHNSISGAMLQAFGLHAPDNIFSFLYIRGWDETRQNDGNFVQY